MSGMARSGRAGSGEARFGLNQENACGMAYRGEERSGEFWHGEACLL